MKKTAILIILGILLVALIKFTSAIYPGECDNVTFPNSNNVIFELISNSSPINGFIWEQNGTLITYCFSKDFPTGKNGISTNGKTMR